MTFKEFSVWCNKRACDGCWSMDIAMLCIGIYQDIKSLPFWKRKKRWKELEQDVLNDIVNPINKMIEEKYGKE